MTLKAPFPSKCRIGQKIKVPGERMRYVVRAASERFVIMTKPMNALKTYLYSIVDLKNNVRGPDDGRRRRPIKTAATGK